MKQVLYIQSTGKASVREKLAGFYRIARKHADWNVQVIDPSVTSRQLRKLIDFWKPDGLIISCGDGTNMFDPDIFDGRPAVFLGQRQRETESTRSVWHEAAKTAALAAKELLSFNLAAYAFVPYPEQRYWSDEREKGFIEILKLNNKPVSVFGENIRFRSTNDFQRKLSDWLAEQPKPIGVFAANDAIAAQVLAAAKKIGLSVPDDVAIIGVDNDELVCENSQPTLSSVVPDFGFAGEAAGRLLAQLFANKRRMVKSISFGPLNLIRRASTARTNGSRHDAKALAALDLIRRQACNGLKARDVVAIFTNCARRTAELRFRAAVGRSILEEIRRVRLERARELLRTTTMSRDAIANQCGYASAASLWKLLNGQ